MQTTESTGNSVLFSSKVFLQQVTNYINNLETVSNSNSFSKFIKEEFTNLTIRFISIGDSELNEIEELGKSNIEEVYVVHFVISEPFKDIAILHRDILLQLQISSNNQAENLVSLASVENHFKASKELLIEALYRYTETISDAHTTMRQHQKRKEKLLSKIKHLNNPWRIYKIQFETIQKQIKDIYLTTIETNRTLKSFVDIRTYNSIFLLQVTKNIEQLKEYSVEAIQMVKDLEDHKNIKNVIIWIDKTIQYLSNDSTLQFAYSDNIELKIKSLRELTIPVDVDNGLLLTKKIDFNKTVDKWFDFEIMPEFIDLWENKSNMESYFKHSLYNFKMSLLLAKNNNDMESMPSQLQALQSIHSTINDNTTRITTIIKNIEQKFSQFLFSNIYTNEDFLEVSIQSSISNFKTGQSNFLSILKKKIKTNLLNFNENYGRSTLFTTQNKIEHSIQTINYRMFKEENVQYDTLFRNKNFIGDLFLLPRKEQEATLTKSIVQWHNGFNKAILVTGDILSGKSTFVESIGQKNFKKRIIYLERDSTITFCGRKFTTTRDLKEALQNIKKGLSSRKYMLILDNLELWKDNTISLLENTRAILSFIASEADNVLVVVTCSKQMQSHLDKRVRFSEAFSTKVSLNKATFEEIFEAILLRHGASHKDLISDKHEILTKRQIEKNVAKLSRKFDYNIGEILQAWTYGTTIIDKNKVIYNDKDNGFKDFFNSEEVIILKYVLLYKNISEVELKNFVGTTYETSYKTSLKRLTNTKVLLRQDKGQLKLNRVVAMDIKQILIYRGYIN